MTKMPLEQYTNDFVSYMVSRAATPEAAQEIREYAEKTAPTYYEDEGPFAIDDPVQAAELDMSYWD